MPAISHNLSEVSPRRLQTHKEKPPNKLLYMKKKKPIEYKE